MAMTRCKFCHITPLATLPSAEKVRSCFPLENKFEHSTLWSGIQNRQQIKTKALYDFNLPSTISSRPSVSIYIGVLAALAATRVFENSSDRRRWPSSWRNYHLLRGNLTPGQLDFDGGEGGWWAFIIIQALSKECHTLSIFLPVKILFYLSLITASCPPS